MHFTYCPQCGEKLQPRPAGDEGLVPVKSIFVCKIPLGTQNLMQKPYFAAG